MNSIARMMKRSIKTPPKYPLLLLCVCVLVFVSISGCTSPTTTLPSPSASSVPTATPVATATPTATPIITTPSGATSLSSSDLATLTSYMESHGYTVNKPFAPNGTDRGYPAYSGTFENSNGSVIVFGLVQTDSPAHARVELTSLITDAQSYGFAGSYQTDGSWLGTMTNQNSKYLAIDILVSGNTAITAVTAFS